MSATLEDLIPADAQRLTASCVWCPWSMPIQRDQQIEHTCWNLRDGDDWTFRREPAIRITWLRAVPYVAGEHREEGQP